jgi:hypothetical protein
VTCHITITVSDVNDLSGCSMKDKTIDGSGLVEENGFQILVQTARKGFGAIDEDEEITG